MLVGGAELDALVRPDGDKPARVERVEVAQRLGVGDGRGRALLGGERRRRPPGVGIREQREQQLGGIHRGQRGLDEAAELVGKSRVFHYSGSCSSGVPSASAAARGKARRSWVIAARRYESTHQNTSWRRTARRMRRMRAARSAAGMA